MNLSDSSNRTYQVHDVINVMLECQITLVKHENPRLNKHQIIMN